MANLTGTDNPELLFGTDQADQLAGGRGADTLTGGAGADVFAFSAGDGGPLPHDVISDFVVGVDRLSLPDGAELHTENDPVGQWVHYGADRGNNDWVQLIGVQSATIGQLLLPDETGPPGAPTVGNDSLRGFEGSEIIDARAGNDSVDGQGGADTIAGGPGYDLMTGGEGADVFAFAVGDGGNLPHDVITDFQVGTDRLLLPTGVALHTEDDPAGQWVHYGADRGNNDWIQLLGVRDASLGQLTRSADVRLPTTGPDSLDGSSGADVIDALTGDDQVDGGAGADTILGGPGDDLVAGAPGADVFVFNYGDGGGLPHDRIADFQVGTDRLVFPAGAALYTEEGTSGQWVHYGDDLGNNDWILLFSVRRATLNQLTGLGTSPPNTPTLGDDALTGTASADLIRAGAGTDVVSGAAGADTLEGGEGADTLSGQDGDDRVFGSYGADVLSGGGGNDTFAFGTAATFDPGSGAYTAGVIDTGTDPSTRDVIVDFEGAGAPGGDTIDLSVINLFGRRFETDSAFTFIGAAEFSGQRSEVRYAIQGGNTLIQMDGVRTLEDPLATFPNLDRNSDGEILVLGIHPFVAGDFIL